MKLTALLAQERREGIEQGREEGVNVFYSSSLRCTSPTFVVGLDLFLWSRCLQFCGFAGYILWLT